MRSEQDLTCLQTLDKVIEVWMSCYNAVQTQVVLAKFPQETAKILHRDTF